ncbi:hypothetical protein ACA040_002233 [Xenophilus aerolatus]
MPKATDVRPESLDASSVRERQVEQGGGATPTPRQTANQASSELPGIADHLDGYGEETALRVNSDVRIERFLKASDRWICDRYWIDVRYVAERGARGVWLSQASIYLSPVRPSVESNFQISTQRLVAGQLQKQVRSGAAAQKLIGNAARGHIEIHGHQLRLAVVDCSSEMSDRERWYSTLQLSLISSHGEMPLTSNLSEIDDELRMQAVPFDGLSDLCGWLGLQAPGTGAVPQIHMRVAPPCDMIFEPSFLRSNRLRLTFHAHPAFDTSQLSAAIRIVPGKGLASRRQIADQIVWRRPRGGLRPGVVDIEVADADAALAVLMVGGTNVRRQWFSDPAKARNRRLLAVQHFDKDLRKVRAAVLDPSESSTKFEHGVATLLFLLGFTVVIPIETDSPDIIASTPGGQEVVVECTTRIADFASKVGKLVDRRTSLARFLAESRHFNPVSAALVCRLPRDQIANQDQAVRHGIILISLEDLVEAFNRISVPGDADELLKQALERLAADSAMAQHGPPNI